MRTRLLNILIFCLTSSFLCAQSIKLSVILVDATNEQAVEGAHLFLDNTSNGTISDQNGRCEIEMSQQGIQPVIITHLSYETQIIPLPSILKLASGDTIRLKRNAVEIDEIQLLAKRSKGWKQNYKKFLRAFIGRGKAASQCEVVNPEVLRFKEEGGILQVSNIDLIEIENKYLGYNILFWLEELVIEKDGSSRYKGYAQYSDQSDISAKSFKQREKIYENSLQHFLLSLTSSSDSKQLKKNGYKIAIESYQQGKFNEIHRPEPSELISIDSTTGYFRLSFPEFLTVYHQKIQQKNTASKTVSVSGAEQQKFGSARTQSLGSASSQVSSHLYKVEPHIVFNKDGNILNKAAVREYGYWAEQRIATTLPIDYESLSKPQTSMGKDTLSILIDFLSSDNVSRKKANDDLLQNWSKAYIPPLLDILRFNNNPWYTKAISEIFKKHAPEYSIDYYESIQQLWQSPPNYGNFYADYKANLYKNIDPKFYDYFSERNNKTTIRLDEVVWGGVAQDGIPPLRNPKMIQSQEATFLSGTDVIFGVVVDGQAFAYPKRILAWHEFFTGTLNGVEVAGAYCTLCGSVIIYKTKIENQNYELGTSGFLYRSNKLMYDEETQSLWSMLKGKPVIGPLIDKNISLESIPVETTTWEEWNDRYPDTKVLSLETGYNRNYDEGEAYKAYFSNDALMFPVPNIDKRLANKARVFIPRSSGIEIDPLALSVDFLKSKRLHIESIADERILILTKSNGAISAYKIGKEKFESWEDSRLYDEQGKEWIISDSKITGPKGEIYTRIPGHEVFWFAWVNVYPLTRLVH